MCLWHTHHEAARSEYPRIDGRRLIHETIRRIINTLIVDLIETTSANLAARPASLDDVRESPPLVAHSDEVAAQAAALKRFLFKNLYRHYSVMRMANKARRVVTGLFTRSPRTRGCCRRPIRRAGRWRRNRRTTPPAPASDGSQARLIAHYIAGMTDRYALKEYQRLFVIDNN